MVWEILKRWRDKVATYFHKQYFIVTSLSVILITQSKAFSHLMAKKSFAVDIPY